jgi:nitrogen fixation/metabolism regulation signal transduction histidine kinase
MSTAVVAIAPDKTVSMMNRAAEKTLGLTALDVIGRSVQRLGSSLADVALRALGGSVAHEAQEVFDPGAGATLRIQARPSSSGGVLLTFDPVAEPQVAAADVAGSPFWEYLSSRVAQEVKNPMVAINTFAQLLPRKYDSEDFRDTFSRVVQEEVQRINAVVETLFEFARNPDVHMVATDVSEPIHQVLESFEDELKARAIDVEYEEEEGIPVEVDPKSFKQALENVVKNSIEAMPEGGRLRVGTRVRSGQAEILVADTGRGVEAKDEPQIFLPFFSTKERGMGLGLTMADRIMKQHHGKVRLARTEEADEAIDPEFHSTFILDLPVHAPPKG